MNRRTISNYRWLAAVFCLLTILSATVAASSSHTRSESSTEIVEFEEFTETVPTHRNKNRNLNQVASVDNQVLHLQHGNLANLPVRAAAERDQLNGFGGYLLI